MDDEEQQHINSLSFSTQTAASSKNRKKKKKNKSQLDKSKAKMGPMKPKSVRSKDKKVISEKPPKSNGKRRRTNIKDVYDDIEAKFSVMERADRVLSSLSEEVPTFIKCMLPSNVSYSFWMILPIKFCKLYLPSHDTPITLVNEKGNEYKTTYLLGQHGLSAGWRGFSMSHRLLKGDILVFQLIEPYKFKVHIVRVNGVDVVDAALCLINIEAWRGTSDSADLLKDNKKPKRARKYADCFLLDVPIARLDVKKDESNLQVTEQSENNSNGSSSEGCEISNIVENNDIYSSGSLFLHEHPLESVACR